MTSSSSLYGTVTTQNSSSTNSTSLYGGADTPIPDSSGNVVVRGDLYVLSGNILTTASTGNIFPTNATTVNLGLAATSVNIGAGTGTTTINNNLVVDGTIIVPGAEFGNITIAVADDNTITTTSGALKLGSATGLVGLVGAGTLYTDQTSFNLLNSPTTVNAFQNATALNIGETTGTTTVRNALTVLDDITAPGADLGLITIGIADNQTITTTSGELRVSSATGNVKLEGVTSLYTDTTGTFALLNAPTTVTAFQGATALTLGATTGTTTVRNNVVVQGGVTANGADFGSIQIAVADNQLITTTAGELRISSATGIVKLEGVTSLYTDTAGTFNLLNAPATVNAFQNASTLSLGDPTGTTTIRNNVTVGGDLTVTGNDIKSSGGTTAVTLSGSNVTVAGDLTITGNDIKSSGGTTAITLSGNDVSIADDLTITGNTVNLAQASTIAYDENADRANRPQVQSTTGNSSGFRVLAPNATTNASSNLTVFATNDINNGEFLSVQATGSTSAPFNIRTGRYIAGVLNSSGEEINFIDNITTYASINPAGPTNPTDLTTKAYVDALPANITYTIDATSTTGGANLNLVGSDSTTDTVKFANGTGVTVSYTDASTATVAIGQAVGTGDDVQFNSVRTGTINANAGVNFVNTGVGGGTYATVNAFGPANTLDLTTVGYVNSILPTVVTYDFAAASTTGGANLSLTGSNSTTDTVKLSNGGNITATYTSATEVTLGSNATDANTPSTIVARDGSGNFSAGGATLGNISVGVATDNTIASTDTNGNINITPNGTGTVVIPTADVTTLDVTNIRALDGTAAASIANSTGIITVSTELNVDNINVNGNTISSTNTNGDILITPNGTGDIDLVADTVQLGDANATATLTTNGTGDMVLNTNNGTAAGSITLAQGTNGAITVAPNGTGRLVVTTSIDGDLVDDSYILGQLRASTNTSYTFPPVTLSTVTSGSGVAAASSISNGNGYSASSTFSHYYGDTRAGANTAPAFTFQAANGVSDTSVTRPWEGTVGSAASAITANGILGTFNFGGYATTDWAGYISGMNQGGGFNVTQPLQAQGYATETFANGTLSITPATATGTNANVASVQITGTKGQISFTATTPAVGNAIVVTGVSSGTGTGITAGTYYVIATNGSTTAQLSATPGGAPITTTAGTTTSLTFSRQFITVTYSAQTYIPFGLNAFITIAGISGVTNGTYMAQGTSTTTQVLIGVATPTGARTLTAATLTCPTVTAAGAAFRVRGVPVATPLNSGNRFNFIDHSAAAATYRADTFTIAGGAYGGTSAARVTVDSAKVTMALPVAFPVYTAAAAAAVTGAVGWQISISNSPTVGGRMAFWDTTNARWSYISDNTAV